MAATSLVNLQRVYVTQVIEMLDTVTSELQQKGVDSTEAIIQKYCEFTQTTMSVYWSEGISFHFIVVINAHKWKWSTKSLVTC